MLRLSYRLFFAIIIMSLSLPSAVASRVAAPPATPIRLVQQPGSGEPIRLEAVSVDAEVHGTQAMTHIELRFYNPNARVLEGQLEFPLLAGQSVIALAMDVDGKLRDGVPVEKIKGRQVFEDVVRQRIDPALLELTQGNHYKLRVYPIPPKGTKRVRLKIAETLPLREQNLIYRLPLSFAKQLPQLQLMLKVFAASAPPVALGSAQGTLFAQHGNVYEAHINRGQLSKQGLFEIHIPAARQASMTTQLFADKTYFQAEIPAPNLESLPRRLPARVALYWDASGSGAQRDHAKEFALLDRYFRAMGQGEVVLVRFRDRSEAPAIFKIANGNWSALKNHLEKTDYDGATALGAISPVANAAEALLFSDGLGNYDNGTFPNLRIPVYVVASAAGSDNSALQLIAARSGGQFADLVALPLAEAAQRVTHEQATLTRLEGAGLSELIAASNRPEHGRWLIAGVAENGAVALRATLRLPDGKTTVLRVPIAQSSPSKLAAYTWARLRLAELDGERRLRRGEIRRLGQLFRMPTAETSLIVLDRIEDYVQHNIEPPLELKADYDRLVAAGVQARQRERGAHLEQIVRRFVEIQAWWNKDFPKNNPPQRKLPASDALMEESSASARSGRATNRARRDASELARPAPASAMASDAASPQRKMATEADAEDGTVINLKKWTSDAPYIARFKAAHAAELYRIYMDERPSWVNSSAFFLDAADALFDRGQTELALRVLSNLAEMDLENRAILRILGYRLTQAKQAGLAIPVFEKVLELAPDEPQSHRDLGLAYAENKQLQQAVDALYEVVSHPWHGRFPDVEMIALAELNAIIARSGEPLDLSRIDKRLIKNMPLDLRVVLIWDADDTDIDLWVTDPNGEKAFYGNPLTYQGGAMSRDFTGGYGPEGFSVKRAKPGKYLIQAQFYGHRQQVISGATSLQVKVSSGFGTAIQRDQIITLRLKEQSDLVTVGEVEVR